MKIKPQQTPELTQLGELIKESRVCMLTTHDEENLMVARPMVPQEMCEQGSVWFLTDPNTNKMQHLQLMNLAFSDEGQSTYVSISGHGELVTDRARIESLWSLFARPWFPDGVDSANLALLKFVPHVAEYWDAPDSKMVRMFANVLSIAAAKPIGMGEHGNLDISKK